jgi:hypothetical protein
MMVIVAANLARILRGSPDAIIPGDAGAVSQPEAPGVME